MNLCIVSKSALPLTPGGVEPWSSQVCTLRCVNTQRDTNTSPRQKDVELENAALEQPESVCTLRSVNTRRDTKISAKQKDVELENAALEQGRGCWPHGTPGTHYGSVNRVQVVGDWLPRPGHGALQWRQLHNPHDSANICGRRAR